MFDSAEPYSVGVEDEVMLLDGETHDLLPRAQELLVKVGEDPRFKLELPASQLEIMTPPSADVQTLGRTLLTGRRDLVAKLRDDAVPAAAGVHPHSAGSGELNRLEHYERAIEEYGAIASRQLVCALQVHVAPGDAGSALAVYNAARSYLPALAALAANAPFYEGRDTGLASVRPKLAELLPRQGVPPAFTSWEQYAEALRWGAASGTFERRSWWWELRPHPRFGTIEFRVPDGQTSVDDAVAIAAVAQALVAWLAERYAAGERLHVASTWRIEENRWSACRHGVLGLMADLESGKRRPTREALREMLHSIGDAANKLGGGRALSRAQRLVEVNGAMTQRRVAESHGIRAVAPWLAEQFLASAGDYRESPG